MTTTTRKNAGWLPCVEANEEAEALTLAAAAPPFAYEGRGLTLAEFRAYVASYDFGSIEPDQLVIHNTANPDASWAPLNSDPAIKWDRDEYGVQTLQVYNKRNTQLDRIRNYYRDTLGWQAGPHLFIDDRWIWLFTPMDTVGVHAREGNSYRDAAGRLHYSIGIEVVGWYGRVMWPPAVLGLLKGAIHALAARLGIAVRYQSAPPPQARSPSGYDRLPPRLQQARMPWRGYHVALRDAGAEAPSPSTAAGPVAYKMGAGCNTGSDLVELGDTEHVQAPLAALRSVY